MIIDGRVTGLPLVNYADTKAAIEALTLTAADAGATAYATDTEQIGFFNGAGWEWLTVADYLTDAKHTAIGDGAPHHAAITLNAAADTLLSLSTQQVGLDTQAANLALAGPVSGAAAVPTFRALVSADLPAATEAAQGAAELATAAEVQTGTDTTRIVTPAGLRADVPATPAASRGVRLDANGDALLPAGGDVLPDGATDVDHGIDARLRLVSGPVALGDYGYNPLQVKVPSSAWALGIADGSGRDDFFADNYAGGTTQWTAVAGCTPYGFTVGSSWLNLTSDYSGGASPNHAIIQETISGHAANDYYWTRMIPAACRAADHRIGMVLMQSDLKKGAAAWIQYYNTTMDFELIISTYDSANAWLSQANAKTSSVAWTTDWTSRYTSAHRISPEWLLPQVVSLRLTSSNLESWQYVVRASVRVSLTTFSFTPAYIFMLVEGNLANPKQGNFDFVGRNVG